MKMKKLHLPGVILTILLSAFGISGCKQSDTGLKSRTISFDKEWRFLKNNPSGAETPALR